jgi:signal transduction histidine kinase
VFDELREVSRGIHPAILTEAGLRPALRALARRSTVPVNVDVRVDERLPAPVEAAAYYVASEALANVAKHAQATVVELIAARDNGDLTLEIRDDGIGGVDAGRGSGILGLTDRVEALGGTISIKSPAGGSTTLSARLPIGTSRQAASSPHPVREVTDHTDSCAHPPRVTSLPIRDRRATTCSPRRTAR